MCCVIPTDKPALVVFVLPHGPNVFALWARFGPRAIVWHLCKPAGWFFLTFVILCLVCVILLSMNADLCMSIALFWSCWCKLASLLIPFQHAPSRLIVLGSRWTHLVADVQCKDDGQHAGGRVAAVLLGPAVTHVLEEHRVHHQDLSHARDTSSPWQRA